MERIIQIDSTFVNKNIYPYDTDFIIPINGTPPSESNLNDSRCIFYTEEQILDRFIWIGNDTIDLFNDISGNTVKFDFYVLDNTNVIGDFTSTIPPPNVPFASFDLYLKNVVQKNNYFVGCFFYFEGYASQITQYNGVTKRITLLTPFPFHLTTYTPNSTGFIINPSQTSPSNLVVLLETSFTLTQTLQDLLGVKTLNRSQSVWQVRTDQQLLIQDFTPISRDVLLLPQIFDYRSNDLFLVRPAQRYLIGQVQGVGQKFWYQGIYDYDIVNSGSGYSIGDNVQIVGTRATALLEVIQVQNDQIIKLRVILPGDGFTSNIYSLIAGSGVGATIRVRRTAPYVIATNDVQHVKKQFLMFLPDFQIHVPIQYFVVLRIVGDIVYFYTNQETIDNLNNPSLYYNLDNFTIGATIIDFIPYQNYYPSINLPMIGNQQSVCYRIDIASITLPNLPVCGYNILLANFPYVLITLMNSTSGSIGMTTGGENYGMMISNNPHAIRSSFVCPIANIRNPDYVRFVVVNSNQSMVTKFTPNDALRFTVNLPNGELLKFQNNEGLCEKSEPLTRTYIEGDNMNAVYAFRYRRSLVSVTFTFTLLQ